MLKYDETGLKAVDEPLSKLHCAAVKPRLVGVGKSFFFLPQNRK